MKTVLDQIGDAIVTVVMCSGIATALAFLLLTVSG